MDSGKAATAPETVPTGVEGLDDLLGGLRVGDNVVWETDSGGATEVFLRAFLQSARDVGHRVVFVSFDFSPHTVLTEIAAVQPLPEFILLDCFTAGKGEGDPVFADFYANHERHNGARVVKVESPASPEMVQNALAAVQRHGPHTDRYIFDSLTGMLELWGEEAQVLRFFAHTCPKLYDLRTIAYWMLEKQAHTASFLASLKHITQVVIELCVGEGREQLVVRKAAGRRAAIGVAHEFRLRNGRPEFPTELSEEQGEEEIIARLGARIRRLRGQSGLSQAKLARLTGLSPSAISQMENGAITPSLRVLVRLSRALQVSVDTLLTGD